MGERKMLSAILRDAGRITRSDIESALEYQRIHGGLFGEALVALGILSHAEVDWALASQFELPYIFPDPEGVDAEVAALVPPDWALAHLAVPILRAGETLTVVVADPLQQGVVEELRHATGLEVELALASPTRIRGLIRALYDGSGDRPAQRPKPLALVEFIGQALAAGAERFGLSARGPEAWGWYARRPDGATDGRDLLCRHPLTRTWEADLVEAVQPLPLRETGSMNRHRRQLWTAALKHGGRAVAVVDVEALAGAGGVEYLFRSQGVEYSGEAVEPHRVTLPAPLIAELRLLAHCGRARIAVAGEDPTLLRTVLGSLPLLVLDEPVRAVHLTDQKGGGAAGVLTLEVEPDDELLSALDAYSFDALTVDLPADRFPLGRIIEAAPLALACLRETDWQHRLPELGIGWILSVSRNDRSGVSSWKLSPVDV